VINALDNQIVSNQIHVHWRALGNELFSFDKMVRRLSVVRQLV